MTHLYFHRADLDGIGSAIVILHHLLETEPLSNIVLHPWNYGDEMKEVWTESDHIILVDISFPPMWMQILRSQWASGGNDVTWIDHHKTAIADSVEYKYSDLPGMRLDGIAAIELSWLYCFQDGTKTCPHGIKLLSDYDVWKDTVNYWDTEVLPFQYGMRTFDYLQQLINARDSQLSMEIITKEFFHRCNDGLTHVLGIGDIILKYQANLNRGSSNRAFPFTFFDVNFACINQGGINSSAFDFVKFDYDACMAFSTNGDGWKFSMYGCGQRQGEKFTPNIDLSVIAKTMGGGGHAKACGFETPLLSAVFGENRLS